MDHMPGLVCQGLVRWPSGLLFPIAIKKPWRSSLGK